MKNKSDYKAPAVLMIIHAAMEIGGAFALIPIFVSPSGVSQMSKYFSFIVPYLQENLPLMLIMGGIYGTVRLVGAIGLLKNRMWGFVLSAINCAVTMALMIFMLPAGVMDGILACSALVLMLIRYFGKSEIGGAGE